jgi:hypothetical protein
MSLTKHTVTISEVQDKLGCYFWEAKNESNYTVAFSTGYWLTNTRERDTAYKQLVKFLEERNYIIRREQAQ